MALAGRGGSRGGRILQIPDLPVMGRGRGRLVAGRGISKLVKVTATPEVQVPDKFKLDDAVEKVNEKFDERLSAFIETGEGCLIETTLDYFSNNDDVQNYVDKIMNSLLKSSVLVTKFAMSFKLITLIKAHGVEIKTKMLSKFHTTYKDMLILMKDSSNLSKVEKDSVRNFCELLGQMYFRLRLPGSSNRYNLFAAPTIECLNYLLKVRLCPELIIFFKLLVLNYSALYAVEGDKMLQLSHDIRTAILIPSEEENQVSVRVWLLCALDYISYQPSKLPPHIRRYYADALGREWVEAMGISPMRVLIDIPNDVEQSHMDKFDISVEEYNKYRFDEL